MSRSLLAGSVLVMLGSLVVGEGSAAADRRHRPSGDDMHELPTVMALRGSTRGAAIRGVTLYLNGDGATLAGGWDDSSNDVSSVAVNAGQVTVPAWKGGDRAWNKVVQCVRDRFSAFAVDIVTERPRSGDYVMMMVGGRPSMLGYSDGVGGVAPYTGEVMRSAVGYVFSENLGHDVENTCVSILHEAGHTLGLDHAYLCEDPMTYLWNCGQKQWQDVDTYCGEGEARSCGDGEMTQNSYRHLADAVGLRDEGSEPEPEPEPEPDDDDPPYDMPTDDDDGGWSKDDDGGWNDDGSWGEQPDTSHDGVAPAVAIDGGAQEQLAGNQWIEVVVRTADDGGVADVALGWASETQQFVINCSAVPADMPVQCQRDGDTFRFQLFVGTGLRAMIAQATDRSGNQGLSEARVVYLTE